MVWQIFAPGVIALIDKLIPDREAAAKAKLDAMRMAQEGQFRELDALVELARQQANVNAIEAAQGSYRGGWRPFIGWVCGASIAYQFVARPLMPWALRSLGADVPDMPALDTEQLWPLIMGMLGLGGLRSWEKLKT
jgi:hypothetical protein